MEKKLPLFELNIEDLKENYIDAISLVDLPAIEEDFIFLSQTPIDKDIKLSIDSEKKIITGAVLVPDKEIYRRDSKGNEFNVVFRADSINKISQYYLENFKQKNITLQHKKETNDVSVIESWIILNDKNDKANELNLNLPKGCWVATMKINNDEIWDKIKDGTYKGFSIEAFLSNKLIENSKTEIITELSLIEDINDLLSKF